MKKAFIIFASLMVCIFILFGCTSESTTTTTTSKTTTTTTTSAITTTTTTTSAAPPVTRSVLQCPQGEPDLSLVPVYGGTLKLIYPNNPTNLGAMWKMNRPWDKTMNRFAIENLIGLDTSGLPVPQLAESWVQDPVKMTITFTLRQGVKFHDGTAFDAEAAAWNLNMYKNGAYKDLAAMTAIDVIDDYHLKLTLASWDPLFLQQFSSTGAGKMVSPTKAQALGDDIMLQPVGTGPFKFVSFEPNVSLKYERFDDYWQQGLPYLDAIEVSFVTDSVVALASFTKGEGDVLYDVKTSDAKNLTDNGYTIYRSTLTIMGICGDSIHPDSFFANINFRRAIAYAIDYKKDVDAIFGGFMIATNQLALPGFQGYDSSIVGYPYNPDKAKELLAPLGITPATPLSIDFTFGTDPQRNDLFTLVQGDLAKVGINLNMKPVDRTTHMKVASSGWDNALVQYSFSYNGLEMQYSTSIQGNMAADKVSFVSVKTPDEYQALFITAKAETDLAKRESYYQRLNKIAIDGYCVVIPLFALQNITANAPYVHDCGIFNNTSGEFLPEQIWLSK